MMVIYKFGRTAPTEYAAGRTAPNGKDTEMENTKLAVQDRVYRLVKLPSPAPKGLQPVTILQILLAAARPMSVKEVAAEANARGYQAAAGTTASVAWHLHQFSKAGYTALVAQVALASKPVEIDFGTDTVAEHVVPAKRK